MDLPLEVLTGVFSFVAQGSTALHAAATLNQPAAVERLIEKGADVAAKNMVRMHLVLPHSPFPHAHPHTQVGATVVHDAAMQGHLNVINALIAKGVNTDAKDYDVPLPPPARGTARTRGARSRAQPRSHRITS